MQWFRVAISSLYLAQRTRRLLGSRSSWVPRGFRVRERRLRVAHGSSKVAQCTAEEDELSLFNRAIEAHRNKQQ